MIEKMILAISENLRAFDVDRDRDREIALRDREGEKVARRSSFYERSARGPRARINRARRRDSLSLRPATTRRGRIYGAAFTIAVCLLRG